MNKYGIEFTTNNSGISSNNAEYYGKPIKIIDFDSGKFDGSHSWLYAEVELACTHESKTYDNKTLLESFPPKRRWTCDKCGEIGYETVGVFDDQIRRIYKE